MNWLCRVFPFLCKPKPAPRRPVCVNVPSPNAMVTAAVKVIKPSMVRTSLYVDQWVNEAERYRPEFSRIVRHYEGLGVRVVVCLTGENLKLTLDQAIPVFVQVTGELLDAHPNVIVQVANEADGDNPFNGNPITVPFGWFLGRDKGATQMVRGALYGRMYQAVASAHGRRTEIVTTGICLNPAEFLRGMRSTNPLRPAAVCIHVYSAPLGPTLDKLAALVASAPTKAPVWVTEAGWPLTDGGEDRQSKEIASLLDQFDRSPAVAHVFAFTLNPDAGEPFRLLRLDGSLTPAGARLTPS